MPGLLAGQKRRSSVLDDDEDESRESSPTSSIASTSKRARLNGASSQEHSNGPLLPETYRSQQTNGSHGSASQKHQPGAIVRVTLKNFVTYTTAEFLPGPSLNMVIGPNGTGKSTLVCAICLGLGWKTEHLGRAKDIGEFVKHGSKEAEIEIELAADGTRHTSNPIIRHHIKRDKNKSTYFLDDRPVSRKAITELCRSFSIQVDNLCQFLPQDRVVEFAALNPVDLLAQTQRAAAPDYMVEWHEQLKTLRVEQKKSQDEFKQQSESLKNLEGRQTLQQGDVDRLRERADVQERISALEKMRPLPAYRLAKTAFSEAKERKKEAHRDLTRLEQEVQPALAAVQDKEQYRDSLKTSVDRRKKILDRAENEAETQFKKQEDLQSKIDGCTTEADAERDAAKKYRSDQARLEQQIVDIERLQREKPPQLDAAEYNERIRELTRQMRETQEKATEVKEKQRTCVGDIEIRNQRIRGIKGDLDDLRSHAGQQTNKLKTASRDTARAWDWIQDHRDLFDGEVFAPPIISCSIRDQRHAAMIESMLNAADVMAFTVTSRRDFTTLSSYLYGKDHLNLSDVNIRNSLTELIQFRPPVSQNELQQYGLDNYLLDLIDGPKEVLAMLCDNRNIHQTGVAFRGISNEQYEALARSSINSFVTPTESFMITRRREYGDRGTSTRTQQLKTPRFFTSQPVDTRAEQELKANQQELEDEIRVLSEEARAHKNTSLQLGEKHKDLQAKKNDLSVEKEAKQKAVAQFNALPTKMQGLREKLAQAKTHLASFRTRILNIKQKQDGLVLEKGQLSLDYANSVNALQNLHVGVFEAELQHIEAQSDFETLDLRNAEVNNMLKQRQQEVKTIDQQVGALRKAAEDLLAQCQTMVDERTDREKEIQQERPADQTPEALENEIESLNARLDMVHEGNPHILREFEERAQKIEKTKEKVERLESTLNGLNEQIAETQAKWEPELDRLIEKISDAFGDNFARIGCAGQVSVYKDEDFENWAIQVQVKFRENEQLSVLDSHRQSGGERAVSTIFYLMALQSLARAPFRVVDEINQGMDPRNERLVHSRIVDIACAENTSQYFLITPKLLPNLTYHPNMKVHCIASGEYMPDDHRQLDFPALAKKALHVRSRLSGVMG